MKKYFPIFLITGLLFLMVVSVAYAQSASMLNLGLSRDFGYGGFGNDIQGLFTLKISNPPANLTRVVFFIDSNSIGEDTQAPFSLQFNTDSYPLGVHILSAVGTTSDGNQIDSNKIEAQFVPASASTSSVLKIVGAVLGLIVLMALIAVGLPLLTNKGKLSNLPLGAPRKYGIGGGAICPKCGRPFQIRLWFIHLGMSRFDRCPYCGKWSLVLPRSQAELREAEKAELANTQSETPITTETETEKLKKEIDDSRFQNM